MLAPDLAQVIEEDHRALDSLVRGNPDPKKKLFSRRNDVTLANPLGPPARGWGQLEAALERAVAQLREGEPIRFERISEYATAHLATSSSSSGGGERSAGSTTWCRWRFG